MSAPPPQPEPTGSASDTAHLEELVEERQFVGILQTHAGSFFRLSNTLLGVKRKLWNKKHIFQLINEADSLESFLDDYGARYNQTYAFLTEVVASIRGFASAGYSLTHMLGRMDSYGLDVPEEEYGEAKAAIQKAKTFIRQSLVRMMEAVREEAVKLGVEISPQGFPEDSFKRVSARRRLPRNVGQADLVDEEQKIAEVATKYLQACAMLAEIGIQPIEDPDARRKFFANACTEEQARVYEATVHNLQSFYDTHIQNTVLEGRDPRLPRLRGHVSTGLHLLQTVTHLVHFIERHEDEVRSEDVKRQIGQLVRRQRVQEVTLNSLLVYANRFLQLAAKDAEALLPAYTDVQELEVEVPTEVTLHARPVSLIVGIVQRYGTPVQMEVAGQRCNAASILELLVCVGSHPEERTFRFHGDVRPLLDIRLLFESGLGELGTDSLPDQLDYLDRR